jgi:hypothetical protein
MKITVLTGCDASMQALQDITIIPVKEYCSRYGYDLSIRRFENPERPASWIKLPHIDDCFQKGSDYVFWIDTDATIVNQKIKLESFIKPGKQFYYARNFVDINAGVFMMQNTLEMRKFLRDLWNRTEFLNHPWWENTAMMAALFEGNPPASICEVLDEDIFNCPWYWSGCFVHHLWGISMVDRIKEFSKVVANRPCFD